MKFSFFALVALFTLVLAGNASAAIVDYNGGTIDMGNVAIGQSGTIDASHKGNIITNSITGTLPANSMITFSYSFAGNLALGLLSTGASYSYDDGGVSYAGWATDSARLPAGSGGTIDGAPSTALVVASAQIDFTANTATAIIKNLSSGLADYSSFFAGLVRGKKSLEIAYNVSAVPVPAALPLFGAGLAGLAGFGMWRRRRQADAA